MSSAERTPIGRIRAVTTEPGEVAAARLRAALEGLDLPAVSVDVRTGGLPRSRRAQESLTSGQVDYVLLVDGDDPDLVARTLPVALALLRGDLTTAAAGPSATGAPHGTAEMAASARCVLLRAEAFREIGVLARDGRGRIDDLDLGVRLWRAGHRVRAVGGPRVALCVEGDGGDDDAVRSATAAAALRRVVPLVVDDDAEAARADGDGRTGRRRRRRLSRRQRPAAELVPRLRTWTQAWATAAGLDAVTEALHTELEHHRTGGHDHGHRVLVLTADVLAAAMAGPAIRAVAIAQALAADHEVRLVTTQRCDLSLDGVDVRHAAPADLAHHGRWADLVVFQGWLKDEYEPIFDSDRIIVVDAYDPMHLEQLEQGHDAPGERGRVDAVRAATETLNRQLRRADLVLCASTKQRDLWLGTLASLGRVNPVTYDEAGDLGGLLRVVPFGTPDTPMPDGPGALRGVVPGIGPEDKVLLWGGGVYNWFDPITLVHAVDRLRHRVPEVRLYFLGLGHPNPEVPAMRVAVELRSLADELGLTGRHVFFNEGWVDFGARAAYLRDADIAVSTHQEHLETEFSFRTRILDYLWAGLPVVTTAGDVFAELVDQWSAGRVVPAGDVEALESALADLLTDPGATEAARAGSRDLAATMTWSQCLEPLVEFCRAPHRAPDVACPTLRADPEELERDRGLRRDIRVAADYVRGGDVGELAARVAGRARRQLSGRAGAPPADDRP